MAEPVIDRTQYYGQQTPDNGCVVAIATAPQEWTVAVAYCDGILRVVSAPELEQLLYEAHNSIDALVAKMAERLGMVGHMIGFTAAPAVISLAALIIDANNNGGRPMPGRGELHTISGAAA